MQHQPNNVTLVVANLTSHTLRLQPWRYMHEVARQLAAGGRRVTIISDGAAPPAREEIGGVPLRRIGDVRSFRWRANPELERALAEERPDLVIWNVGVTSFLHQRLAGPAGVPTVGVFTSPIYRPRELARLGAGRLARGYRLSAVHVLGTLLPHGLIRAALARGEPGRLVSQTLATQRRLLSGGAPADRVTVIRPGIDDAWGGYAGAAHRALRAQLGYAPDDSVVLYFGSPAPLRGLHTLIRALESARRADPSLRLMVLNRRRADELLREDGELRRLLAGPIGEHVRVVSGFLDEGPLVEHVAASDIVALPFELVPSDAPLSLLEARALGKPVVTSDLGCLPELAAGGPSYLARPADPISLGHALVTAASDLRAGGPSPRPSRSWQEMGEEWSELVERMTQRAGRGAAAGAARRPAEARGRA